MSNPELGKRYSLLYINRGEAVNDSKKARYRISQLADYSFPSATLSQRQRGYDFKKDLTNLIQQEIGVPFRTSKGGTGYESWQLFFDKISFTELLDAITVIISPRYNKNYSAEKLLNFRNEVRRIFHEENIAFTLDDQGGVHPLIDTAFTQATNAAIDGLVGPRYEATLHSVEEIEKHLLPDLPNYVGAIRSVFGACENIFKLMYGGSRLDSKSAFTKISSAQQRLYEGHPTMLASSAKLLNGFREWIDAAHFYRHEEGRTERGQPESEIAILLISEGLAYVRWLAAIDKKNSLY